MRKLDNEVKIQHINEIIILTITIYIVFSTSISPIMNSCFQIKTQTYLNGVLDPSYSREENHIQSTSTALMFFYLTSMGFFIIYYTVLKIVKLSFSNFTKNMRHLNFHLVLLILNLFMLSIYVIHMPLHKGDIYTLNNSFFYSSVIVTNFLAPVLCLLLLLYEFSHYSIKYIIDSF